MAATNGTLTLVGKSGRTYSIDTYIPDAVAGLVLFNPAGLAGSTSDNNFRVPEDCTIYDVSIGTAPTAVGMLLKVDSAPVTGGALRYANQLQTLANRQKLTIGVKQGSFIGAVNF